MAKSITSARPPMSQDFLLSILRYDPETGKLFWKERQEAMFADKRHHNSWNAKYSGKEACVTSDAYGYHTVTIFNRKHKAHRIICIMVHGEFISDVDHINGVRNDNRLSNLRIVSHAQNQRNVCLPVTNTSGVIGVCWHKAGRKWHAQIKVKQKNVSLGLYADIEDAIAARKAAEVKFGFHANHGRNSTP